MEWTRNIGIAAHIDAGKTTTTERILYYSGAVHKMGEVHEGTTVTDWMEQERERGITITAAAISCAWIPSSARSPRSSIGSISSTRQDTSTSPLRLSVRSVSLMVPWLFSVRSAACSPNPRLSGARPTTAFRGSRSSTRWTVSAQIFPPVSRRCAKNGRNAHPLFLPIGAEENFSGLVDLVQMNADYFEDDPADPLGLNPKIGEIPAGMLADAKKYREELIEAVADCDDEIAHKYLEGAEIGVDELMVGIRKATVSLKFSGVIPGSAFKKKGVQRLLDCVVNYLPSPLDLPPSKGQTSDGVEAHTLADDRGKTVALAFKLWSDPFVGRIVFARVYQGKLSRGQSIYNPRTRRNERISRLLLMRAMDKEEIDVAYAGDICAVVGVKDAITGDTLCDDDADIRLEPPTFPETVISMSIEPKSKADQEKMGAALQRLSAEDPTFRTFTDTDTGQVIIAGMGELHLEIIRDRMFREFKVDADAGKPQIAYRESITGHAEGEGKFSASPAVTASTVTPSSCSRQRKGKAARSSTKSWAA